MVVLLSLLSNNKRALSSFGRAPVLHSGGEEFDSPRVHKNKNVQATKLRTFLFSCGSSLRESNGKGVGKTDIVFPWRKTKIRQMAEGVRNRGVSKES